MSDPLTWSTAEVAAALGHPVDWFYRNAGRLRVAGFPPPLPIVRRYDPAAVRAWIAGEQKLSTAEPLAAPAADDDAGWGAVLDRRAAELGRTLAGA